MGFAVGESVGPFQITAFIGRGGMATIYKAYQATLDRDVALKVIHPALKEDETFLARFKREAAIVAKLHHPNIVTLYDFAEYDGTPYLVMQYIDGKTLKDILREQRLSTRQIMNIVRPVSEALAFAHARGILHRDVKPSNILIDNEGHVYLTDFGLARVAQSSETTMSHDMMVGSPQYASPEQAKSEPIDERTDEYSLGVVMFEMFTGQPPFKGETPYGTMMAHINNNPPAPRSLNPRIPPAVEQVLLKTLAKNPQDRYPNIFAMMQALERAVAGALDDETPASLPLIEYKPGRVTKPGFGCASLARIGAMVLALGLVLACIGGAGFWALNISAVSKPTPIITAVISTSIPNFSTLIARTSPTLPRSPTGAIATATPTSTREVTATPIVANVPRGKIAYTISTGDAPEANAIWIAEADGSNARAVIQGANWGALSPDGKQIAYHNLREEGIYVANVDGGNVRRLFGGETCCAQWSPDGKRLAFMQGNLRRGDVRIMLINADGSGASELTIGYNPAWSPDGNRLVYAGCANAASCGLFVYDLRNRTTTMITRDIGGMPQWSPRGDKIVYQAGAPGSMAIFTVNPDGSNIKQLTAAKGNNGQPVWSSDGNFIFWRTDQEGREWAIYVMRADGTNQRLLIPRAVPSGAMWAREALSVSP
jgi:serine/threonine protein kinase